MDTISNAIGLSPLFTGPESDYPPIPPFERRDITLTDKDGKTVFRCEGCYFPESWSYTAGVITASKYFRMVDGQRERSVQSMVHRVTSTLAEWGSQDGYFQTQEQYQTFAKELQYIVLTQRAAFNSPVWFNVGVVEHPQASACFTLDVQDTMESIFEWIATEARIFKGGSGAGVNISKIRPKGAPLSGGGTASGPLSFAQVADAGAGAIKSGGTTRRAAKMLIMDAEHPDILEFVRCKWEAELLAKRLIALGEDATIEHGAHDKVPWQNANHSVSVSDDWMYAMGLPDTQDSRSAARYIFEEIARCAWECGDPGLWFRDTVNAWHTTPLAGPIICSNPCGEFLRPPNEACNLASINLLPYLNDDGTFDVEGFCHTVDVLITAMDILVGRSSYPTEAIATNARRYRPVGLGYANLGALLMCKGLAYDSDEGRDYAAAITALMTGVAYSQSAQLASVLGAFAGWKVDAEAMDQVIINHRTLVDVDCRSGCGLWEDVHRVWQSATDQAFHTGYRNCQVTVLAPTGTIGLMMDCDTLGCEPDTALVKTKSLVGGGVFPMVNGCVPRALKALGYEADQISYLCQELYDTGVMRCRTEHLPVFATALGDNALSWQAHIAMVAALQPHISGGISKTINMSHESTIEDVKEAYLMAWQQGLKSISLYRDGSKGVQPVHAHVNGTNGTMKVVPEMPQKKSPVRAKLPDERPAITHKFAIAGHEGYFTVGLYGDGSPGELFVRMSKEGSTLGGLMDAWATSISIALQYGVPLEVLTSKFAHTRYEPMGVTDNADIRFASSITDYIARWLAQRFLGAVPASQEHTLAPFQLSVPDGNGTVASDAPMCTECGGLTVRSGNCYACTRCGTTTGCS